jgi:hypothetical protein
VYVGDPDAVDAAEKELDGVEADRLLSRGRLVHTRFLEQREAEEAIPEGDPTELEMFERARLLYHSLGDSRGEAEALLWIGLFHQVVAGDDDLAVSYLGPSLELATLFDDKATMPGRSDTLNRQALSATRISSRRSMTRK